MDELNEQTVPPEAVIDNPPAKKTIFTKKNILIGIAALVLIAAIVLIALYPRIRFNQAKNKAVDIAGQISSRGNGNFTVDTNPYEDTAMDPMVIAMLAPDAQEGALNAIEYVNEALGFNGALYDRMLETNALMGRQSEENKHYRVSWTYHPDEGLEVTYEIK